MRRIIKKSISQQTGIPISDIDVDYNTITGEVELDPWIVGVGVSYRF